MPLTPAQLTALKAEVTTNPLYAADLASGNDTGIAAALNADASPTYYVYRTALPLMELTDTPGVGDDGVTPTTWSYTTYVGRSQGERDAFLLLFRSAAVNPSLPQVRAAFSDIFSGAGGAAQRTHCAAKSRRAATRAEKLFATGAGSAASPANLTFFGAVTPADVAAARNA